MARSIWKGTLSFGLVNVPVKLYSAVRSRSVHFNQLHAADNGRIRQKRVCAVDGEEVPLEEIVKGYEIAKERYVVVEDAELDALAPKATQAIEIEDFVELGEIEDIYLDQSYYVVPDQGGMRTYRLLLDAMRETGRVAIARVVLRSRERLVAVHPRGEVLLMTTMNYADEITPTSELSELGELDAEHQPPAERELEIARLLIESLARPFEIERYHDSYREALLELIERKARGEQAVAETGPAVPVLQAPDLISALEASLAEARSPAAGVPEPTQPARKGAGRGAKARAPAAPRSAAKAKPAARARRKPAASAKPKPGTSAKPKAAAQDTAKGAASAKPKPGKSGKPKAAARARAKR